MNPSEVAQYIGYLIGFFAIGYAFGFLLLTFKKSAGFLR